MLVYNNADYIPGGFIDASQKHFLEYQVPHGHDFFEIEFIIDGTGTYEVDGIAYPIRKNTLFLLTPANIHRLYDHDVELINVMFTFDLQSDCSALAHLCEIYSPVFVLNDEDGQYLCTLLKEIVASYQKDKQYALDILRCVFKKLILCTKPLSAPYLSYVQHAILYMLENFRKGITLELVAKHLGVSRTYLSNLFMEQTGVRFKAYLDNIRFSHAQSLLRSTDLPIDQVCASAGFNDYANFSRRFKTRYLCSPSEYRQRESAGHGES